MPFARGIDSCHFGFRTVGSHVVHPALQAALEEGSVNRSSTRVYIFNLTDIWAYPRAPSGSSRSMHVGEAYSWEKPEASRITNGRSFLPSSSYALCTY